jgi:hypothetical protein
MFLEMLDEAMGWSDAQLDERVRANELELRRLQAERAALLSVMQHRGSYADDGHRSLHGYLRATTNVSSSEAGRQRKIADVCNQVPALGDALSAGRIGEVQIAEIARIHVNPRTREFFARVAPIFLELAEHDSHDDLHNRISSFLNLADQDGAFVELCCQIEHRSASANVVGGTLDVRATGGDPLAAEEFVKIFEWFREREFEADVEARRAEHGDDAAGVPLARTDRQRRFDALITMARAAAAHGDGTRSADVTIDVLCDPVTLDETLTTAGIIASNGDELVLADLDDDAIDGIIRTATDDPARWIDRRCETSRGTPIHPSLLLQVAMRGYVRRVVVDASGTIIDFGRRQRFFTGPAREAAKLLVRRCSHPGCTNVADQCDVDHNDEWYRSTGPTDQRNSNIECHTHNLFKTRSRWRIARDEHGRTFHIRPDGSIVLPVGAREPDLTLDTVVRRLDRHSGFRVIRVEAA